MANSLSLTLSLFLLFSLSSAHNKTNTTASSSGPTPNYAGCFPKVYAFGDSDTDTGNTRFLGTHFKNELKFNVSTTVPTRLVVDFLCAALSLPPLPPFMSPSAKFNTGINFAISGSTSLEADFYGPKNMSSLLWSGVPLSFKTQSDWFNDYLNGKAGNSKNGGKAPQDADVANALFWIGQMGVSDYTSAQGTSVSIQAIAKASVKHVTEILKTIISQGAKYIVVQGLPPVGCFPCYMSGTRHVLDKAGCVGSINAAISSHNEVLQWALQRFRKMHPQCAIAYADYWNAYLTIATNPEKYGMEETFKACCGSGDGQYNFNREKLCGSNGTSVCKDPQKYINWDGICLTETMDKHLADLFLHQGFCHPSFDELVKKKKSM